MRVIYTRQSPFIFYVLFSFSTAALALLLCFRFGLFLIKAGHSRPNGETVKTTAAAPAICQISADEDVVKCGTSAVLTADDGYNPTWSNGATTTSITVTQSGQYWWQYIDMSHNTVTNGDFSSGKSGFQSDYDYISPTGSTGPFGALSKESYYTVTTDPHIAHTSFSSFSDHSGGGKMMVINGSPQNNVAVWSQSITVEPNTTYIFSIWGASAHPSNPAKLAFSINGTLMGIIQLSTTTGNWQNFTVQWQSDNSTSAAIAIVNQNTIANGNDFALDDVVFAPICRKYFNVTLYPDPPKPDITAP